MPDFYAADEYDLAGFIVGVVEQGRILEGKRIAEGDLLVGIDASGLHTNGYTLARKIVFEVMGLSVDDELPGTGRSVADELLAVHRSYLPLLWPLIEEDKIEGLAHITGGGIPGNLPRVLPEGLGADVDRASWDVPAVFRTLQDAGGVTRDEMDRVFNMGIGMIAVVREREAGAVVNAAQDAGMGARVIGRVTVGDGVRYT
jgi:phosphoribosylformylglycinamidine cyclo-ligase